MAGKRTLAGNLRGPPEGGDCESSVPEGPGRAPGKRTLTEGMSGPRSPAEGIVQREPAGGPLDAGVRSTMEGAFGTSFGDVRVHQDGLAEQRGALAVTEGHDVHFAAGAYAPEAPEGQQLIGHELTHVVQQERGGSGDVAQRKPNGSTAATTLLAADLEAEADRAGGAAAAGQRVEVQGVASGRVAQNFGAKEHREIGDTAAAGDVTIGTLGYKLSYGELAALAGDLFRDLQQMEELASKRGPGPDTQEAIDYARYIKIGSRKQRKADEEREKVQDKRYRADSYSAETRESVDSRYYMLAADNPTHFVRPKLKDAGKAAPLRPMSAGATYRSYHETAIGRAVDAAVAHQAIDPAMAAEGFGAHFLSDACSAGHMRTPRQDIRAWWDARDFGFYDRFQQYMIWRVTEYITHHHRARFFVGGLEYEVYKQVNSSVLESFSKFPKLTMGALVALAAHDYDDDTGLHVLVAGKSKFVYGDGKLHNPPGAKGPNDTAEVAVNAVRAGVEEVKHAYQLGQQGKSADEVMAELRGSADQYAAEALLPQLDPAFQGGMLSMRPGPEAAPKWKVDTFAELLKYDKIRHGLELTIGGNISEIEGVAKAQPEPGKSGILNGFVKDVREHPIDELMKIYMYDGHGQEEILKREENFEYSPF